MNSYQKRTLQAFRRIQGWLVAHPELSAVSSPQQSRPQLVTQGAGSGSKTAPTTLATIPGISPDGVAQQVAAFNAVVDQVTAHASEQEMHDRDVRGAGQETARARRSLLTQHMRHVAIIAESAIPDVVRMTAGLKRPRVHDAEAILAAADAMAKAATQYRSELVQRGLPADFIEQLQRAAEAYKRAIDTRGAAMGRRVVASSAVETAIRRGRGLVSALSVLVERRFADDANLVAEWEQLKHVVPFGVRSQVPEAATSPSESPIVPAQLPAAVTQAATQVSQTPIVASQAPTSVSQAAAA